MSLSDDSIQSTGPIERVSRPYNRRDSVSERRQQLLQLKQTDNLPTLHAEPPNAKIAWRQLIQLREENKRLRWELAEYQRDSGLAHSNQQQDIEHLQHQVEELTEERDHAKDAFAQLEHRYQELYHTFQSEVEEEAGRMVEEAARTLVLTPEHRPSTQTDLLKTVELHVRQAEDRRTAEALYLMRQAQRKASQLEQELATERQHITIERQNLHNLQRSASEQAQLRKQVVTERLQTRYALKLTAMTVGLLILLLGSQFAILWFLHFKFTQIISLALLAPLLLCLIVAGIVSTFNSRVSLITESAPHKHPAKKEEKK